MHLETMQSWFGLKEEHKDFSIETDTDAALFFARHELDEHLQAMLRRSFRTGNPPKMVRTVFWQYWFTDMQAMERTGEWWKRQLIGPYAPPVMRGIDGQIVIGGAP